MNNNDNDLFVEAKRHWSNARRNLDSTGEKYDIHEAFMSLGQANWCLTRATSDTERVSKAIKTELDQMTQFLKSDPFSALDMKLDGVNLPTAKDVKQAYRTLVKRWHPDKQNDKRGDRREIAHELFIILQHAYEELQDEKIRKRLALRHTRVRHFNATLRRGRRRPGTATSRRPQKRTEGFTRKTTRTTTFKQKEEEKKRKEKEEASAKNTKNNSNHDDDNNSFSQKKEKKEETKRRAQKREERAAAAFAAKLMNERRRKKKEEEMINKKKEEKEIERKRRKDEEMAKKKKKEDISAKDILHEAAKFKFCASFARDGTNDEINFNLRDFVARHAGMENKEKENIKDTKQEVPNELNDWLLRPAELIALRAHFAAADFDDDGFLTPIEVVRLAGALGEFVTEDEAKQLASTSERIDFNAFVTWWQDGDDEIDEDDILRFSSMRSSMSYSSSSGSDVRLPPIRSSSGSSNGYFWGKSSVDVDNDDNDDDDDKKTSSSSVDDEIPSSRAQFWGDVKRRQGSGDAADDDDNDKEEQKLKEVKEKQQSVAKSSTSSGGFFWGSSSN